MTRLPVLNVCRTGGTTCGNFAADAAGVCRMHMRRADTDANACALDVADQGETESEDIAAILGCSPEYVRQVVVKALEKAHRRARLLRLEHLVDAKRIARHALPPAREIRRRGHLSASVLVILSTGAASLPTLAEATSSSIKSIRKTLARLAAKRLAVRTGDTWSLAS
jgi:hypothetical protein